MSILRLILLLLLSAAAAAAGCQTAPKAGLSQAIADYEAQRFAAAHQGAVDSMRSATGIEREQAAYVAGLSAFQLGRMDEAELRLQAAVNSSDKRTAANAKVMLGQIRLSQGRHAEAATMFETAAPNLDGEDARQATRFATRSHQLAGNTAAASRLQASSGSGGGTGSGFTLQVGAFQERQRADSAASAAGDLSRREGLGQVSVVPRIDSRGRLLYVVQLGHFMTRMAAEQARERIGKREYIVSPISSP